MIIPWFLSLSKLFRLNILMHSLACHLKIQLLPGTRKERICTVGSGDVYRFRCWTTASPSGSSLLSAFRIGILAVAFLRYFYIKKNFDALIRPLPIYRAYFWAAFTPLRFSMWKFEYFNIIKNIYNIKIDLEWRKCKSSVKTT